jgi:hypothetical protein
MPFGAVIGLAAMGQGFGQQPHIQQSQYEAMQQQQWLGQQLQNAYQQQPYYLEPEPEPKRRVFLILL